MHEATLFAGPSAFGIPPASPAYGGIEQRPPVRRADIDRLVEESSGPGVVVICDGVFHSEPAVSHAEICRALDRGWQVWGVSSLGAIRAYELRAEGMRGHGYVHSLFERFADFTDDEMCLLHFPEEPYFPVSEALVNLRFAFERHKQALGIADEAERDVIDALRALWFGDRTEARMRSVMIETGRIDPSVVERLMQALVNERIKTRDLVDLLERRPWRTAGLR